MVQRLKATRAKLVDYEIGDQSFTINREHDRIPISKVEYGDLGVGSPTGTDKAQCPQNG